MYFQELQNKLVDLARERVRAGEFTERALARACGLSQPHMHNVLKNIRTLSNESADRLMRTLSIDTGDLLWRIGGEKDVKIRAIPIIRNRIGPGSEAILTAFRGNIPMPSWMLTGLVDPVLARLAPDLVLPHELAANDFVLLDQNPTLRADPIAGAIWVVADPSGLRVRYLRTGSGRLHVGNKATRDHSQQWISIPLHGRNILDLVRARIVRIDREVETQSPGPSDASGRAD